MSGYLISALYPVFSGAGQKWALQALLVVVVALAIGLTGCKLKPKETPDSGSSEAEASGSTTGDEATPGAEDSGPGESSSVEDAQKPADLDSVMVELRALRTEVGALREEVRTLKADEPEPDANEPVLDGLLSIDAKPGTASVLIDGETVAESTPLELHELSPGEHRVQVEFHESGRRSPVHEVVLPAGGLVELVLHDSPDPEPAPPEAAPAPDQIQLNPDRAPAAAKPDDEPVRRRPVPESGTDGVDIGP